MLLPLLLMLRMFSKSANGFFSLLFRNQSPHTPTHTNHPSFIPVSISQPMQPSSFSSSLTSSSLLIRTCLPLLFVLFVLFVGCCCLFVCCCLFACCCLFVCVVCLFVCRLVGWLLVIVSNVSTPKSSSSFF